MNYNSKENIEKCRERIDEIEKLPKNYDGYGAEAPDKIVCDNARTFFQTLCNSNCLIPCSDEITPTPYGTIVFDLYSDKEDKDLISIEIGTHQIGFFTDYRGCGNYGSESDGIDFDFKTIPYFLNEHINLDLIKMNKHLSLRRDDLEFRWSSCNGQFEIVKWFQSSENTTTEESKEWCIMEASFVNVNSDGNCDLKYCGTRPLELSKEEFTDFQELVRFGYDEIKKMHENEDSC